MDLSFITRVTSPQNGNGTLQGGSTRHQTEVLRAADLLVCRNTAGKEIQRGQGRRKRSQKSRRTCESPRGPRRTSSVLSFSWTRRKPWQVLHLRSRWEAHQNRGSRQAHRSVLNFSHNSPSRSRKELPRSNPRQEPGNGTPTTDGTNCSLLQLVAGHREGRVLRQEP